MTETSDDPTIEMIPLDRSIVILSDGQSIPVIDMADCDGEETDDPEAAVALVAGPDKNGQWWSIYLPELEPVSIH